MIQTVTKILSYIAIGCVVIGVGLFLFGVFIPNPDFIGMGFIISFASTIIAFIMAMAHDDSAGNF